MVCMDAPPTTRFVPCHHSAACVECAEELLARGGGGAGCLICSTPIARFEVGDFESTFVPPPPPPRRGNAAPEQAGFHRQSSSTPQWYLDGNFEDIS